MLMHNELAPPNSSPILVYYFWIEIYNLVCPVYSVASCSFFGFGQSVHQGNPLVFLL